MRQVTSAEKGVQDIRRKTRRWFSANFVAVLALSLIVRGMRNRPESRWVRVQELTPVD